MNYHGLMELYHVLNRGVDKRKIFLNDGDRVRFVHGLYTFNDDVSANNTRRALMNDLRGRSSEREKLVDIHAWIIMDNHYHLLLSERTENGITKFLTKLNIGYAKYFNDKYKRVGTLFQGRTKKVRIGNDAQFLYILHYIHLNALDFLPGAAWWRERDKGNIRDTRKALNHLERYRWSSYLDYMGKKNFPSVIMRQFFDEAYGGYADAVTDYLRSAGETLPTELTLE